MAMRCHSRGSGATMAGLLLAMIALACQGVAGQQQDFAPLKVQSLAALPAAVLGDLKAAIDKLPAPIDAAAPAAAPAAKADDAAPAIKPDVLPVSGGAVSAAARPASGLPAGEAVVPAGKKLADVLTRQYLSNAQLGAWMDEFVAKCPIGRKFSIGTSARGQQLWALEISDKPGVDEPEPNFKYVANMHGDETSGRMLLPMLAEWLCANNGKDERATRLVRDTHLFLVPTMNPDGFDARRRYNANGADLNRNFPDPWMDPGADLRQPRGNTQPETKAMMAWTLTRPWAASANMHEGAIVVNYPLDAGDPRQRDGPQYAADDATFKYLAHLYANTHAFMAKSDEFDGGITNGAAWYYVYGGMQDWNYLAAGGMELTLELNQEKFPPANELAKIWAENRDALLALPLRAALGGARGTVTAASDGAPVAATLTVKPRPGVAGAPVPFYASKPHGFYARALAPGKYTIVVSAPGYQTAEAEVTVPNSGAGVVRDFALKAAGAPAAAAASAPAAAVPRAGSNPRKLRGGSRD